MPGQPRSKKPIRSNAIALTKARFRVKVKRHIKEWERIGETYADFDAISDDRALEPAVSHANLTLMRLRWLLDFEAHFTYSDRDRWYGLDLPVPMLLDEAERYYGASPEALEALEAGPEDETEAETASRITQRLIVARRGQRKERRREAERRHMTYLQPLPGENDEEPLLRGATNAAAADSTTSTADTDTDTDTDADDDPVFDTGFKDDGSSDADAGHPRPHSLDIDTRDFDTRDFKED